MASLSQTLQAALDASGHDTPVSLSVTAVLVEGGTRQQWGSTCGRMMAKNDVLVSKSMGYHGAYMNIL